MIDKQYGKLSLVCDNCGDGKEGFNNISEILEFVAEEGWATRNANGTWEHYCPTCSEVAEI